MKNLISAFALVLVSFVSCFGQINTSFVKSFPMSDTFDVSALSNVTIVEVDNNQLVANVANDTVQEIVNTVRFHAKLETKVSINGIGKKTFATLVSNGLYSIEGNTVTNDSTGVITTKIKSKYNKAITINKQDLIQTKTYTLYVPTGTKVINSKPTK